MDNIIPNYIQYGERVNSSISDYFSVKTIKEIKQGNLIHNPHRHTLLYQLNWIVKGDYIVNIDTESYHLQQNNFILLPPNTVHAAKFSEELTGYVVHFSEDFFARHLSSRHHSHLIGENLIKTNYAIEVNDVVADELNQLFESITIAYHSDSFLKNDILWAYLNIVLLKIYEYGRLANSESNRDHPLRAIFEKFHKLLNIHFSERKSVQEYADLLNISPGYLNAISKKLTEKTAGDIIREKVILEAQKSLIYTDESISEIAYKLNYNDSSYFWKFFKKMVNLSPKQYREKYQKL